MTVQGILSAEIPGWRPKSSDYGLNAAIGHWRRASNNKKAHKKVDDALLVARWPQDTLRGYSGPPGRYELRFLVVQRRGPLMDDDNTRGVCKPLRDRVAKWLGTNDAPKGPIRWRYRSILGPLDRVGLTFQEVE